ncbi:coproporphyrinogen III oxidase [Bacillus cytotoxicus]|uniref:Coproporphyrinogen dehydrogenase n=1 Tax=Bacillus cytotoxicus (strain DSM 22905 / CIP 110041 / 391-98 / NVH 391-98) TaxID=315749 RepID=A7GLP3_BACCN|nr:MULTISPECIES: coproporphyrinogen III oxidase [Bacillus cereus group]ABS21051.1 Coproporphyrinogen dehydrogenase [Bacillus cytotoxicus NVH 391-98]AWC43786.1 coproporphyrinogen III oxidase [Bacillus cytotoxicus]MDH2863960.1 coproporphyrinogen III oxidase [Bacillus cytotoxicus]MDH2883644.1 coproporphyrinogen III oxidase [Bacillus cytotoxicus]NZD31196.1 coproporphyrinogen III oxidase [Bacillus cytotoxicus]
MLISIKTLQDDRFLRPLQHISGLFFEESTIGFEKEGANLIVDIQIEGNVMASACLTDVVTGNVYKQTFSKDLSSYGVEKERMKQVKHVVSYVYLSVLQQLTGIKQSWGILTGVRPTKLLHKMLQSGMSKEEAHKELRDSYLIDEEKIKLLQRIVDCQLSVIPDLYRLKEEVSIYIGIPFCPTKCAYCTFPAYAINGRQGSVDSFLGGLHYEIREIGAFLKEKGIKVTTIYYGGGTPTSITAEEMDMLYEQMYESFPNVENVREVTVEAGRPDTITPEKLEVLNKWNIDRISINPQSYHQETLKAIGRHHTVEETIEKYHLARKMGMNNINMDLIIGLPGEGLEIFQHTLAETEKLMPESLTVHTLSFKRASEMTQNKRKYKVAGREEITAMMHEAEEWTKKHNYVPYYLYRQKNILGNLENVGYAMPTQESLYNIVIMEEVQSIIGLGCGASSKFVHPKTGAITYFANPKDPKSYNDGYVKYTEDKLKILEELFC